MLKEMTIDDSVLNGSPTDAVEACGIVINPDKIQSPALRQIVSDMAGKNEVQLASCRHKDWSQQAQCGCVMGCVGG